MVPPHWEGLPFDRRSANDHRNIRRGLTASRARSSADGIGVPGSQPGWPGHGCRGTLVAGGRWAPGRVAPQHLRRRALDGALPRRGGLGHRAGPGPRLSREHLPARHVDHPLVGRGDARRPLPRARRPLTPSERAALVSFLGGANQGTPDWFIERKTGDLVALLLASPTSSTDDRQEDRDDAPDEPRAPDRRAHRAGPAQPPPLPRWGRGRGRGRPRPARPVPRLAFASPEDPATGDVLAVIFLRGGADGLSLVPPFSDTAGYQTLRAPAPPTTSLALPRTRMTRPTPPSTWASPCRATTSARTRRPRA